MIGKEGVGKIVMVLYLMFEYVEVKGYVVCRICILYEFYVIVDFWIKNLIFFDNIFEYSESI